jgi:A/G-specific adenine glycosylase
MLQQTQVVTVVPYYLRFMQAFPNVQDLARAPLERVLELWSGLGYYRRARHLHQAAQAIDSQLAGRFPTGYEDLRALPGIGDYTANAVLSIAFNQPYVVLDGNVARIIARLYQLRGNLHDSYFRKNVEAKLSKLLSRRSPGDFNQAIMELGQTVCLPRGPQCRACPLRLWCAGFRSGNPEGYPEPRPRRATELHHLAVALLRRGTRVALVRGLDDGLLDDLWNFPAAFGRSPREAQEALRAKLARLAGHRSVVRARHGVPLRGAPAPPACPITLGEPIAQCRHNITFRTIEVQVYPVSTTGLPRQAVLRWFELETLSQAAISQLARKVAQQISRYNHPGASLPSPS